MRSMLVFAAGIVIGVASHAALAQQGRVVGLNHAAVSVADFGAATEFYAKKMGFKEAFSFREADGTPYFTYFQINRNTFLEVMQATKDRPAGCPHFGLEVEHLDALVSQLRQRGVEVRDANRSPRTGTRIALATAPGMNIELLEMGPDSLHRKVIDAWK